MRQLLWSICLAGCGRLGFADVPDAPRTIDAPPVDGPPPGAVLGPPLTNVDVRLLPAFGPPMRVNELSVDGSEDDDPTLTRDLLEIFFDSDRDGNHDIWTSRRSQPTDPWPAPTVVPGLDTADGEEHPSITADGLRLYFMRQVSNDQDLYVAFRADRDSPWGNFTRLDAFNTPDDEDMGCVSADELLVFFSSKRGATSTDDLYFARRALPTDPWGPVLPVTELNGPSYDRQPHVDDHGLVIYYEEAANARLRVSRRDTVDSGWEASSIVTELNDPLTEESDPWLSPDLRTIYFTSLVSGAGDTTKDLYLATR